MTRFALLRFLLVGGCTALIYFGLTFVLVEVGAIGASIASSLAYLFSICFNYLLHYHWTFQTVDPHVQSMPRYALTIFGGLVLNAVVMYCGTQWTSFHYILVQCAAALVLVCWTFLLSMFWVFSEKQ